MKETIPLQNPDQTRREAEEQSIDEAKIAERWLLLDAFQRMQNELQAKRRARDQSEQAELEFINGKWRRRANNLPHRNQVHEHIAAELRQHVTSIQAARYLVSRIANGEIANLKIIY